MTAIALRIAEWCSDLELGEVPPVVVERARELILDGTGVALAAAGEPIVEHLRNWIGERAAGSEAVLFGAAPGTARDAALVNATLMHALDFDDFLFGGHATCVILSALLSSVKTYGLSGRELLVAYVAGMEVFGRLSSNSTAEDIAARGWHPTAVYGVIAATAALGRAARLAPAITANAIAIAASSGAGLVAAFGSSVKPLHAGLAAAAAITAVELASVGLEGNLDVLDAQQGFGDAYAGGELHWEAALQQLGRPFRMESNGPSIKQYPCCGGNHRIIENLRRIRLRLDAESATVAKVIVHVAPALLTVLRYPAPITPNEAKFSAQFSVAATLVHGTCDLTVYDEAFMARADVVAAQSRVQVVDDLVGPREHVSVEVTDSRGSVFVGDSDDLVGSPQHPMSWSEVEAKFRANSERLLSRDLQDRYIADVKSIDRATGFWTTWSGIVDAVGTGR